MALRTWKTYALQKRSSVFRLPVRMAANSKAVKPGSTHAEPWIYVKDAKGKKMHYMYLEDCWRADTP